MTSALRKIRHVPDAQSPNLIFQALQRGRPVTYFVLPADFQGTVNARPTVCNGIIGDFRSGLLCLKLPMPL